MRKSIGERCPDCGGKIQNYDSVWRIVRTKGNVVKHVKIRRQRCTNCKRIHRRLPSYIFPYKHYEAEIIKGVLDGYITPDTIGYEDYPCEMTMNRWFSQRLHGVL